MCYHDGDDDRVVVLDVVVGSSGASRRLLSFVHENERGQIQALGSR